MIDVLDFKAEGGNLFWNRKLHLFSKQMKVVPEMCLEKCFALSRKQIEFEDVALPQTKPGKRK